MSPDDVKLHRTALDHGPAAADDERAALLAADHITAGPVGALTVHTHLAADRITAGTVSDHRITPVAWDGPAGPRRYRTHPTVAAAWSQAAACVAAVAAAVAVTLLLRPATAPEAAAVATLVALAYAATAALTYAALTAPGLSHDPRHRP